MSAALYGRDSAGVNRQFKKLYVSAGGVTRELKELWARDSGGVNRKIYSSGYSIRSRLGTDLETAYWTTYNGTPSLRAYPKSKSSYYTAELCTLEFEEPISFTQGQPLISLDSVGSTSYENVSLALYPSGHSNGVCGTDFGSSEFDNAHYNSSSNVFSVECGYINKPVVRLSNFKFYVNGIWTPITSVETY